jgi:aminoglycoside phosphotransferase (APT) family kinase protein
MVVKLKPVLAMSQGQAQSIVDRIAPGRVLARLSEFQRGEISAVYEIALSDGPPAFVLKVYPESMHWKMQKEVTVARLMEGKLGVPIPRIVLVDDTRSLLDLSFLVMTRLEGSNLLEQEQALEPSEVSAVYAQMGRALREIHDIAMESFGYIGSHGVVTPFASNRAYMGSQFDRKLGGLAEYGAPDALTAALHGFVERHAPLLDQCAHSSLCHYDFHTGNLLVERRNGAVALSGILDLENAIAGDPLMDVAKTLSYSVRGDRAKKAGLLAGYGAIERRDWQETLALYELYGLLELWCWWQLIGDKQRAASIVPDLERFAVG